MSFVLDAGALIAVDRGQRGMAVIIEAARRDGHEFVVPAGVIGQAWRNGRRQARLATLLGAREVHVDPMTDRAARTAGELCGRVGTSDVIDASVVIAARRHRATVLSSDRSDLETLDPTIRVIDC